MFFFVAEQTNSVYLFLYRSHHSIHWSSRIATLTTVSLALHPSREIGAAKNSCRSNIFPLFYCPCVHREVLAPQNRKAAQRRAMAVSGAVRAKLDASPFDWRWRLARSASRPQSVAMTAPRCAGAAYREHDRVSQESMRTTIGAKRASAPALILGIGRQQDRLLSRIVRRLI